MSMSTQPVRVSKRSQLLRCAFLLQAAAITACASNTDDGTAGQTTGTTTTPTQTAAGAPASTAAGSAAQPGATPVATAGRPAAGGAGTSSAAPTGSGAAGSSSAAGGAPAAAGSSAAAAGSSAAGSTGGAAGGGAASGGPATFTKVFDAMFATGAAGGCGSCHGVAANPSLNGGLGGLMTKEAAHSALVGKMSSSAMCSGKPYVTAGNPEGSLLYEKVAGTPTCGMRMPVGGMLPAADVELLKGWIMAGALND